MRRRLKRATDGARTRAGAVQAGGYCGVQVGSSVSINTDGFSLALSLDLDALRMVSGVRVRMVVWWVKCAAASRQASIKSLAMKSSLTVTLHNVFYLRHQSPNNAQHLMNLFHLVWLHAVVPHRLRLSLQHRYSMIADEA